ncbi:DUF2919 family protein [Thalassotalea sp. SU-HH00458]|uniref:DUF2919 family protein n=1 Tax=Thalassotalea sp. SU-HH00458 TaxID=3127657 RepID=UPI0033658AB8
MSKKILQTIPLSSFNDEGWIKPPLLIFVNLAFLAKGLMLFVMSLASRGQGDAILAVFFPQKSSLYIALILSFIPILTLISLTTGKIQSNLIIKRVFLLICILQIFAEFSFLLNVLLNEFHPFGSLTFKVLLFYIFLIAFSANSLQVRLFIKQLIKGKGIIESKEDTSI